MFMHLTFSLQGITKKGKGDPGLGLFYTLALKLKIFIMSFLGNKEAEGVEESRETGRQRDRQAGGE